MGIRRGPSKGAFKGSAALKSDTLTKGGRVLEVGLIRRFGCKLALLTIREIII
jgi:hypothetical protein